MSHLNQANHRASLTVAMITKNEAENLRPCLESLHGIADQIVILDSGSTDETAQIAAEFNCDFHQNSVWPGFGRQRQLAQQFAHGDWILWLDADERLTETLRQSIIEVLKQPPQNTIYRIARLSYAFGRFIRHCGWYPGWVERLHPRSLTQYNDKLVHESLEIPSQADVLTLKGDLLHYTYTSLQDYLVKSANYAQAWSLERSYKNKSASLLGASLHAGGRFFRTYILKCGFLDGRAGFLLAVLASQSVFNKHAGLFLLNQEKNKNSTERHL